MPPDEELTRAVIGAAIRVHRELGPGLLESTYRTCLLYELQSAGLAVETERRIAVVYRGIPLDCAHRLDFLVNDRLILELKAVQRLERIHFAQLLTYLRLTNLHVGLLINFNVTVLKEGVSRIFNSHARCSH